MPLLKAGMLIPAFKRGIVLFNCILHAIKCMKFRNIKN